MQQLEACSSAANKRQYQVPAGVTNLCYQLEHQRWLGIAQRVNQVVSFDGEQWQILGEYEICSEPPTIVNCTAWGYCVVIVWSYGHKRFLCYKVTESGLVELELGGKRPRQIKEDTSLMFYDPGNEALIMSNCKGTFALNSELNWHKLSSQGHGGEAMFHGYDLTTKHNYVLTPFFWYCWDGQQWEEDRIDENGCLGAAMHPEGGMVYVDEQRNWRCLNSEPCADSAGLPPLPDFEASRSKYSLAFSDTGQLLFAGGAYYRKVGLIVDGALEVLNDDVIVFKDKRYQLPDNALGTPTEWQNIDSQKAAELGLSLNFEQLWPDRKLVVLKDKQVVATIVLPQLYMGNLVTVDKSPKYVLDACPKRWCFNIENKRLLLCGVGDHFNFEVDISTLL